MTRGERLATALVAKEYEGTLGYGDAIQTAYVAAAVLTLDDRPLSIPVSAEESSPLARIRTNFPKVARWYDPVVEALFAEYGNLVLRQAGAFAELSGK